MRIRYVKNSLAGQLFDAFNIILMILITFVMIYPFWQQLVVSLNVGLDTARGGLYFWPRMFTWENYRYMLAQEGLLRGAWISVLRVVVGVSTSLFCTGLLAYVTSVKWFSARRVIRLMFLITMYFSGGLIPFYLLIIRLGLLNTFTVYWLPGLFGAFGMLLISSYMHNLSDSLAESARMDGCSEMGIYLRIVAPLCLPVFAALAVMGAVSHWNAWFDVMMFNPGGDWDTLQMYLRRILLEAEMLNQLLADQRRYDELRRLTPVSIRAATTMIVTLPIVFVYPFFQKYFIGGLTLGAIKE